ncbi:hypothetical protein EMCRGX_G003025 [Ephydatia muelleri]
MEVESAIDVSKYSRLGPALSATRGTHNQPSSLHFASLALCFLPSLARAADPEDTPASIRVCVLSRDIKGSCLACCPVSQQKVSRMGVAMIGCGIIASFHLDAKMGPAQWHVQPEHHEGCCVIPPHHCHAYKWWHDVPEDQGIARTKCTLGSLGSVHTKPPFYGNFMDRCIKMYPAPVMVEQTAKMMHVVRKQKAIVLGQHWRRFPTAD